MRDLTGKTFGRLTVSSPSFRFNGRTYLRAACSCGTERKYLEDLVIRGNSSSCGCKTKENPPSRTHGLSKKCPEYAIWKGMRQRCLNKNSKHFSRYGGRGITIDQSWNDFSKFLADVGPRPSAEHTLDRVNNDLGYSKENCRWASKKEQARNTARNVLLTHNDLTLSISEWEERLKLPRGLIWGRLFDGWSVERTLTERVHIEKRKKSK